jgi:outer membrane receptor for ferrienterochelin and colicin
MRRIPQTNGFLKVTSILNNKWQLNADIQIVNEQKKLSSGDIADNRIGKDGTNGYAICNLGIKYIHSKFSIVGAIYNVFDSKAKVHGSGIYLPGRCLQIQFIF